MAEFKLVIGDPKSKKCYQREVKEDLAKPFLGMKIGDKVRGEAFDLTGYEFEVTGGSDYCGFPMRKDLPGQGRKKILAVKGVGMKPLKKKVRKGKVYQKYNGAKQRKMVCGNTIHEKIHQINLKVLKEGKTPLAEPAAPAEGEAPKEEAKPAEEKPVETPKEEVKKEAPTEEPKPEEKKEEPPKKEEVKEEPKAEEKPAEEEKKKEPAPEEAKE